MRTTVVGLVTPHVLTIVELAKQAEMGVNVDFHVRDAVAKTLASFADQFNAEDLAAAYASGLQSVANEVAPIRKPYVDVLRTAAELAAR